MYGVGFLTAAAFALLPGFTPQAGAAGLDGVYVGNAYGTDIEGDVGPLNISLEKTAYLRCPCEGTDGDKQSVRIDGIRALGLVGTGEVVTSTRTTESSSRKHVDTQAKVLGLNLLGGLVVAREIRSVATAIVSSDNIKVHGKKSKFLGLKIAGQDIGEEVEPNTVIDVAGLGEITVNYQNINDISEDRRNIVVQALRIKVKAGNGLGLPVGATVVVASAKSGFARKEPGTITEGAAWVLSGKIGVTSVLGLTLGKLGYIEMECLGTNGDTRSVNTADVDIDGVLSLRGGRSTVMGDTQPDRAEAEATAKVERVSLLGGIVRTGVMTVKARDIVIDGVRERSGTGARIEGLKVLGLPLPLKVNPNTRINLPLVGYVILNEQIIPSAGSRRPTEVNGIHVKIEVPVPGLEAGAELIVSHAEAMSLDMRD
jgi:hypothetical protein